MLAVSGDIDLLTAGEFWAALQEARARGPRLIVDISGVPFIAATGLRVLVRARNELVQSREDLVLRSPGSMAHKVLSLTGVDALLTIEDSRKDTFRGAREYGDGTAVE